MSKPSRQFSGVIGEASADNAGPVVLASDLDKLFRMFNPDIQGGGISPENLNFDVSDISSLAPAYSSTSTYSVGDYCTHSGTLYRCTTSIPTAEAWTYAHWTAVDLATELKTHKDNTSNPHSVQATQVPNTTISGVTGTNVQATLEGLKDVADTKASSSTVNAHTSNVSNPHSVTKTQVGLSNVDNTSDLSKPISTATQSALDTKETIADADLLIKNVTFTSADGKFTFTKQGGSTIVIDTNIEKVPGSMALVEDPVGSGTYYLVIYDRSTPPQELSRCPVTALFNAIQVEDTATVNLVLGTGTGGQKKLTANVKDGSITNAKLDSTLANRITTLENEAIDGVTDTDTIDLGIDSHKLTASVKDGSITGTKLESSLYAGIQAFAVRAETAATNAEASETNASTYATNAGNSATAASGSATSASGYATSASGSATDAQSSATGALGSSNNATAKALISEGYSSGTQNGVPVDPQSPYYHNNAKWYMENTDEEVHTYETIADLPAIGVDGDLYIVKSVNTTYRYDDVTGTYVAIGQVVEEVYVGNTAPQDPSVKIWVDTSIPEYSYNIVESINGKTGVISKLEIADTNGLQTALDGKQDNLPSQTSQNGKFLSTNGTTLSWENVDALPSQSGQSGKFLTTDGSSASWATAVQTSDDTPSTPVPLNADQLEGHNASYFAQSTQAVPSGGTTGQILMKESASDYDANWNDLPIGYSNRNLIDNPFFTINQRGVTSGNLTTLAYFLDRWMGENCATVIGTGLGFAWDGINGSKGRLVQRIEKGLNLTGKVVIMSAIIDNTLYKWSFTYPVTGDLSYSVSADFDFKITIDTNYDYIEIDTTDTVSHNIKAVKLEIGAISTLANDTTPNYAEELAKCQRYFVKLSVYVKSAIGQGSNNAHYTLPLFLRTTPTITATEIGKVTGGGVEQDILSINILDYAPGSLIINAFSTTINNKQTYVIKNQKLNISADL